MMRCFMTDISSAINYYSPHLINNYCICSFLLTFLAPWRSGHRIQQSRWRYFLSLVLYASKLHHIFMLWEIFHRSATIAKLYIGMVNVRFRTDDADKCIQEISLKTFINGLFHNSVLLNCLTKAISLRGIAIFLLQWKYVGISMICYFVCVKRSLPMHTFIRNGNHDFRKLLIAKINLINDRTTILMNRNRV